MKRTSKIHICIGLGAVLLLSVLFFSRISINLSSTPESLEETVTSTVSEEETNSESPSAEETTPEETHGERVEVEIPFSEVKEVIQTFKWGAGDNQLGYLENVAITSYPTDFVVGENTICIYDCANHRIVINHKGRHDETDLGKLYTNAYLIEMGMLDGWITIWNSWEYKLMLYRDDTGMEMLIDLSSALEGHGKISRFLEIGRFYIVWAEEKADNKAAVYRYDWSEDKVIPLDIQNENIPEVSVEQPFSYLIGVYKDEVYYCQRGENNDQYILNRETPEFRFYTELDRFAYRAGPMAYLSPDGHLYIMEMFEDRVEISEIKLEKED